jgi:hypothetical protein
VRLLIDGHNALQNLHHQSAPDSTSPSKNIVKQNLRQVRPKKEYSIHTVVRFFSNLSIKIRKKSDRFVKKIAFHKIALPCALLSEK